MKSPRLVSIGFEETRLCNRANSWKLNNWRIKTERTLIEAERSYYPVYAGPAGDKQSVRVHGPWIFGWRLLEYLVEP